MRVHQQAELSGIFFYFSTIVIFDILFQKPEVG